MTNFVQNFSHKRSFSIKYLTNDSTEMYIYKGICLANIIKVEYDWNSAFKH